MHKCYIRENPIKCTIQNDGKIGLGNNAFKEILFTNIMQNTKFIENIRSDHIANIVNNAEKFIYTIINSFNIYVWNYNCLVDWSYRYPVVITVNGKDKILKDKKRIRHIKFTDDNDEFIMGIINENRKSIMYLNERNIDYYNKRNYFINEMPINSADKLLNLAEENIKITGMTTYPIKFKDAIKIIIESFKEYIYIGRLYTINKERKIVYKNDFII